jgi:hypothetical protein
MIYMKKRIWKKLWKILKKNLKRREETDEFYSRARNDGRLHPPQPNTRVLCIRARIVAVEAVLQPHLYFSTRVVQPRVRALKTFARTVVWLH